MNVLVPLKKYDTSNVLYDDGYLKFDQEVNLFDLSHIDYTSTDGNLLQSKASLNSILFSCYSLETKQKEIIKIPISHMSGAYFNPKLIKLNEIVLTNNERLRKDTPLPNYIPDPICSVACFSSTHRFNSECVMMNGSPTNMFSSVDVNDGIVISVKLWAELSLSTSRTQAIVRMQYVNVELPNFIIIPIAYSINTYLNMENKTHE